MNNDIIYEGEETEIDIYTIKFSKEKNYLKEKLKKLPKYTTQKEKEALLLEDEADDIDYFKALVPNYEKLGIEIISDLEVVYFLYYLRKISVSDVLEGIKECPKCGVVNDLSIDLEQICSIDNPELDFDLSNSDNLKFKDFPIGIFDSIFDILNEEEYDKTLVKDINKIQDKIIKNNELLLNFKTTITCRRKNCREKMDIYILPKQIISKVSLSGIYQEYQNLVYYGQFTKQDVDSMYPFERDVFIGLSKKLIESNPIPGVQKSFGI